jgi:PII-like signaling protein
MKTEGEAHRLRIYVNESDRWEGRPLYETIIRTAKEKGLAGATALRGIEGYGVSGRVHSVKVLHLSEDVPIVVEILDSAERIAMLLPVLDKIVTEGAVTIEKVHLLTYRRDQEAVSEIEFEDEITLEAEEAAPATVLRSGAPPSATELTDRAHQIVVAARESAAKSRRVHPDSVDVLLAMLSETRGIAANALRALGIDRKTVERSLRETVSRDETSASYLKTLLAKSTEAAKWLGDEYTGAEHLFLALCQIRPSAATDILTRLGPQPRDICQEVLNVVGHDGDWQRWLADHPEL